MKLSNKEFKNDPLFAALNKFAESPQNEVHMPLAIKLAFRSSRRKARVRKYSFRGGLSALIVVLAVPALANANALPAPVKQFVQKVEHAALEPIKNLVNKNENPQDQIDNVQSSEESAEELPVSNELKIEDKAAKEVVKVESKNSKEVAKNESKNSKEVEKEASKNQKESSKLEAKDLEKTKKQVEDSTKENVKSDKEVAKENKKTEKKESTKDLVQSEKEKRN